jgi:hypothetical protein
MFFRSVFFLFLSFTIVSTSLAGWGNGGGRRGGPGFGQSQNQTQNPSPSPSPSPSQDQNQNQNQKQGLSVQEAEQLGYLREEEKLARDVYLQLNARWGLYIFNNIASAEQRHMDSVLNSLYRYGLTDSALAQRGLFSDPQLQSLYDTLIAQGEESDIAALRTGALIEEVDMQDLDNMIASTDKSDLIDLYEKLHCGSRNHLRSFVRQMEYRGLVYQAQVLDQDIVDGIVDTPMERRCGRR